MFRILIGRQCRANKNMAPVTIQGYSERRRVFVFTLVILITSLFHVPSSPRSLIINWMGIGLFPISYSGSLLLSIDSHQAHAQCRSSNEWLSECRAFPRNINSVSYCNNESFSIFIGWVSASMNTAEIIKLDKMGRRTEPVIEFKLHLN